MVAVGVRKVEMEEVFEQSDIISIHAPELPSTYHIVNEASIASMKDGVILINTARGTAIDEQALAKALLSGKIKTACLDVYDPEPPCADNPLLKLDNCIMTPHIAGQAANGLQRIGYNCYCQLLHFLADVYKRQGVRCAESRMLICYPPEFRGTGTATEDVC